MRLVRARLEELELPLVEPFETSFGLERSRRVLFVTLEERGGEEGIGECAAAREPLYSEESVATARWMVTRHLLPSLAAVDASTPDEWTQGFARWRGHRMAKAAVEMALWDLTSRATGTSLARALGARRRRVPVGVSVGVQPSVGALVDRVSRYLDAGYARVKVKIRPGWDEAPVRALRDAFPSLRLWVDANQAYPPRESARLRRIAGRFEIEQVEQPFPARVVDAHARLQRRAPFRVCLDESIVDEESLEDALGRRALTSLNVKPGRVGGLSAGRRLGRRARRAGVPAWVGGMLETGVGRAHAVALAARPEFTLPADLSASERYFDPDLLTRPFVLGRDSTLEVPAGRGLGVEVDAARWRRARRSVRAVRL